MEEKPKVVVTKFHRSEPPAKKFTFSKEMVPVSGILANYRQKAWETFNRLPLPVMTEEAWRRTDLRDLPADLVYLPANGAYKDLPDPPEELLKPLTSDRPGGQVVILPGGQKTFLNQDLKKSGVIFTSLDIAEHENPELVSRLVGQTVEPEEGKFAALAGALGQNGVVLYVPKGVQVDQPLNSLFWGPGVSIAHLSHILVFLDEGASATYIHEAASPEETGPALHSGIVEIKVSENASLRFVELQSWGRHVWNFSHERISVGRNGNLDWIFRCHRFTLDEKFLRIGSRG